MFFLQLSLQAISDEYQGNDFNYNPNYSYKNDYYIENYIHCWIGTYKQSHNKRTQFKYYFWLEISKHEYHNVNFYITGFIETYNNRVQE